MPAARAVRHRQEPPDLVREVVAQPRHRGELQPVGGLVQAHPHAEVGARDVQRLLRGVDVRGDEQQPALAVGAAERVVLAEDPAAEVGEHAADLQAGRRRR